ncbi:MAG: hypothetical protein M3083_15490, partial [Actinomycetota bacterium]|nr:hypothetical protein [Actinomycetota bacterium]
PKCSPAMIELVSRPCGWPTCAFGLFSVSWDLLEATHGCVTRAILAGDEDGGRTAKPDAAASDSVATNPLLHHRH